MQLNRAISNGFSKQMIHILNRKTAEKPTITEHSNVTTVAVTKDKQITLTYTDGYIRRITKFFKDTKLRISSRTNTSIQKLFKLTTYTPKYEDSGIYKLKCPNCNKIYVEQTEGNFENRSRNTLEILTIRQQVRCKILSPF